MTALSTYFFIFAHKQFKRSLIGPWPTNTPPAARPIAEPALTKINELFQYRPPTQSLFSEQVALEAAAGKQKSS